MELPIYCWRPANNVRRRQREPLKQRLWRYIEGTLGIAVPSA